MTFNPLHSDKYREATDRLGPTGVTAKKVCTGCKRRQSIGQFPTTSDICITCKPQGKNFRRGL